MASAREGVEAHQAGVRSFSGRLFGDRQPEDFDGRLVFLPFLMQPGQLGQQLQVSPPQFRPTFLGPFFVAVLGQELTRIKLYGCPVGCGPPAATRGAGGLLEGLGVHPQRSIRAQGKHVSLQLKVAVGGV